MNCFRTIKRNKFCWKALATIRCYNLGRINSSAFISMTELNKNGETTHLAYTLDELMVVLKKNEFKLPPRDLKIFFRSNLESKSFNSISTRPDSNCFLLELEQLKLICFPEKCVVLHPEKEVVKEFVEELGHNCSDPLNSLAETSNKLKPTAREYHKLLTSNLKRMDFEHFVLEQALCNITSRFSRHVWLTKPALEMLLQKIAQNPSGSMLRRLLAFRKSLGDFELCVNQVNNAVKDLLTQDEDMVSLYLTRPQREVHEHDNVERLLEAYSQDLNEILCEIKSMKITVDETNQFIDTHLSSVRNRMIQMSLFMEMGTLSLATAAVVAGSFGMNLLHGLEEHPYAFYVTSVGMVTMMVTIFGSLVVRYNHVLADTSGAHSLKALKNFFRHVDLLERIVEEKGEECFSREEFKDVLNKLTGTVVTDEESDFIFKMFDSNGDGVLHKEEIYFWRK